MNNLLTMYQSIFAKIETTTNNWFLPSAARLVFAGTLFVYFIKSGMTKLGDGFFGFLSPSTGAYGQIFPKAMELVGFDTSQLSWFHWLVAVAGTWAEFILPVAVLLGLFTRFAAFGMIGFVFVQSYVDVFGHGLGAKFIGTWFDSNPSAIIFDQRAFWVLMLLILVVRGAGPLSLDRVLGIEKTAE